MRKMVEKKVRQSNIKKRYLITKGELPKSAGGGKKPIKEKIIFVTICSILIILLLALLKIFNIM